jgi:hypothetical protein
MPSIFQGIDDEKEQKELADAIVTAVFMGLVRERLTSRCHVFIGYGAGFDDYAGAQEGKGSAIDQKDVDKHEDLKKRLAKIFPAYASQLVIHEADKWADASKGKRKHYPTSSYVITGAESFEQVHKPMSPSARQLALDLLNSNRYNGGTKDSPTLDEHRVLKERGAYYGVADLDNGEVFGPVSTTRQLFGAGSGRWMKPGNGWIMTPQGIASGSNARMGDTLHEKLITAGIPKSIPYVVGYTHGMIFAEHICKVAGGGTAYEVSMNEQTCKNASCFGCTTFMFANGMPPSWLHLGRAESWSPLPEIAGNYAYKAHFSHTTIVQVAKSMNKAWADAVARWFKVGVGYISKSPQSSFVKIMIRGRTNQVLAYWFLDALSIHKSDLDRILDVLPAA